MTNEPFALDTNVLIYLYEDFNPEKLAVAKGLLADLPKIPAQVVSKFLNTCKRLLPLNKTELLREAASLFRECPIIPVQPSTLAYAAGLTDRYKFQLFDAVIVAAAIEGRCRILYSEDMQHKLVVDKSITIINPFL
jgi:predicted nucleic acid-binding protein